jgi:hypothetical protein
MVSSSTALSARMSGIIDFADFCAAGSALALGG